MNQRFRVCLADDHAPLRATLRRLLEGTGRFDVAGEAGDGLELLDLVAEQEPDLVVTDLSMPRMSGLEATKALRGRGSAAKILVLTMHSEPEFVSAIFRAGAQGLVPKSGSIEEVLLAIDRVMAGERYLPRGLSPEVLDEIE